MAGYQMSFWRFGASDFGSVQRRERIYFIGYLQDIEVVEKNVKVDWQSGWQMLASLKIDALQATSFICTDPKQNELNLKNLGAHGRHTQLRKKQKQETAVYKDDHLFAFQMFDIRWPPQEFPSYFDRATFTQRQEEMLYFIDYLWPLATPSIEFVDVNPTLPRLLSIAKDQAVKTIADLRCPWSTCCPTLTSQSKLAIRYKEEEGGVVMRACEGYEVMALIGWGLEHWQTAGDGVCNDKSDLDCMSLAGNAYSAFAVGPVISASLSLLGYHIREKGQAQVVTPDASHDDQGSFCPDDGSEDS